MQRLTVRTLLRRLARWFDRVAAGRAGSERGAVTALVAVLLSFGVLLGFGMIVVDVGRLYVEREELQSGADAAALAAAQTCARTGSCSTATGVAVAYAAANASDAAAGATACGTGPGLTQCPADVPNLAACSSALPTTPYVEVRTSTRAADGSTLLPPTFVQTITGQSGAGLGSSVGACARATWGPPWAATASKITVSLCEWQAATSSGATLQPAPNAGTAAGSAEVALHSTGTNTPTCAGVPAGYTAPPVGYLWLAGPSGCAVSVTAGVDGTAGNLATSPCAATMTALRLNRTVVLVPVYDGVKTSPSPARYHLAGFAAFVLTGWNLPASSQPSTLTGQTWCSGPANCLYGYFVRGIVTAGGTIGGTDYGASVVTLVG